MLKNPGFEDGWHFQDDQQELKVADGWRLWYVDDDDHDRPEANVIQRAVDPARVFDGEQAQQYGKVFARSWAGLQQRVEATEGHEYLLTAWGYVFGTKSSGSDHPGAVRLKIGIDPTGGTDPHSLSVIWSEENNDAISIGDEEPTWALFSVNAVAEADRITVFTHFKPDWPMRQLAAQWDEAVLVDLDSDDEPIETDPTGDGSPRVQYPRTYVLLPPGADASWAQVVVDATWDKRRFTIGGSADDAGIGDLEQRMVIAVNPSQWDGDLLEFYCEYYGGVWYWPLEYETPEELAQALEVIADDWHWRVDG